MWVAAFIGMATSFAECSLAQLYKERDVNGQFRGGPAWYMARGLGMRWMGVLFAVFFAHRLWHNFQRSSGERRCPSPEFFF